MFKVLHQPSKEYGFNRTTWRMQDVCEALKREGQPAGGAVVRQITRSAGFRWRKVKIALTSNDPCYNEKVARLRSVLSNLGPDEAFFSIDEFGPFHVRMTGGRLLLPAGEERIVPQSQKSKGLLIATAAVELSSNQVTHFYSETKNTTEMLRMMEILVEQYHGKRRIYLSWDAAS